MSRVLGVDACKVGWVGVLLEESKPQALVAATIQGLVTMAERGGPVSVIAIDMPIGLPDNGPRRADLMAKAAIGSLSSSVFITPVRAALCAESHAEAVAVNRSLTGQGISRQAYGLRTKLFETESWACQATQQVVEVHPEVSFAILAGAPLTVRKSTWAGAERRRMLLEEAGIPLVGELGLSGFAVGVDDVLDAGVAAWSARRVAVGDATSFPDPPQAFSDGWPCAIWA
jgi:predicted RNase H-like nuclease